MLALNFFINVLNVGSEELLLRDFIVKTLLLIKISICSIYMQLKDVAASYFQV